MKYGIRHIISTAAAAATTAMVVTVVDARFFTVSIATFHDWMIIGSEIVQCKPRASVRWRARMGERDRTSEIECNENQRASEKKRERDNGGVKERASNKMNGWNVSVVDVLMWADLDFSVRCDPNPQPRPLYTYMYTQTFTYLCGWWMGDCTYVCVCVCMIVYIIIQKLVWTDICKGIREELSWNSYSVHSTTLNWSFNWPPYNLMIR